MRLPPYYTIFCLLVIAMFAYSKYQGLAVFDSGTSSRTNNSSSSGSGSSFHYAGTSSGYHK